MFGLTSKVARQIIEVVGSCGSPPEWGFQFFTVGIDSYLKVLEEEYLKSFIKNGGSSFKMVIGAYGGGKTHFLYNIRELAWKHNFIVSYCSLRHDESPFYKLDKIYKAIVQNLMLPMTPQEILAGGEKGLDAFLKTIYMNLRESEKIEDDEEKEKETIYGFINNNVSGIENLNFLKGIRQALTFLFEEKSKDYENILQWLYCDGYDRHIHRQYGILQPVERGQAFSMIRSLVQWIKNLKYSGIVILFDEAERVASLTSKQIELLLSNIRELIDECGHSAFKNVMIFYAIPDESPFERGKSPTYEAVKQRISTVFDFYNPTGVKISLDNLELEPILLLREIGKKLKNIYEIAFSMELPKLKTQEAINIVSEVAHGQKFGDIGYKRLFVQGIIRAFNYLKHKPDVEPDAKWALSLITGGGG